MDILEEFFDIEETPKKEIKKEAEFNINNELKTPLELEYSEYLSKICDEANKIKAVANGKYKIHWNEGLDYTIDTEHEIPESEICLNLMYNEFISVQYRFDNAIPFEMWKVKYKKK